VPGGEGPEQRDRRPVGRPGHSGGIRPGRERRAAVPRPHRRRPGSLPREDPRSQGRARCRARGQGAGKGRDAGVRLLDQESGSVSGPRGLDAQAMSLMKSIRTGPVWARRVGAMGAALAALWLLPAGAAAPGAAKPPAASAPAAPPPAAVTPPQIVQAIDGPTLKKTVEAQK